MINTLKANKSRLKVPANKPSTDCSTGNTLETGIGLHLLVIVVQVLLLLAIYSQTATFDFVYFDDTEYVVDNSMVRNGLSWEGVKWAFSSFYMSNWHPLTWISHMLDVSLAGTDPGFAHLHSAALHLLNSLLVYLILLRLCKYWAAAAIFSLLFLVHPLHVESVAWIAERKDLLCAFFFLSGILAYDWYREKRSASRYQLVVLMHALALLSKPMAVTFPVVLIILDLFYYERTTTTFNLFVTVRLFIRSAINKFPLLLFSFALGVTTIVAQHEGGAVVDIEVLSLGNRLLGAVVAYGIYLKQFVIPIGLSAFYPVYSSSPPVTSVVIAATALVAIALLSLKVLRRKPLVFAGYCWYLVMLLPVIGILQVGGQAHADRYMYLPSVGLLLAGATLFPSKAHAGFRVSNFCSALIIVVFSVLCFWQVGNWSNRNTLFQQVLRVSGPSYATHIALAQGYSAERKWVMAEQHAHASIQIKPHEPLGYKAVADIALARGKFKKAEDTYRVAAKYGEPSATILNNLGIAIAEQGNYALALDVFNEALSVDPNLYNAAKNIERYQRKLEEKSP